MLSIYATSVLMYIKLYSATKREQVQDTEITLRERELVHLGVLDEPTGV